MFGVGHTQLDSVCTAPEFVHVSDGECLTHVIAWPYLVRNRQKEHYLNKVQAATSFGIYPFIQVKTVTDRERASRGGNRNCNKYNITVSKNELTDYNVEYKVRTIMLSHKYTRKTGDFCQHREIYWNLRKKNTETS